MRRSVYADLKRECDVLAELLQRRCRVGRVEFIVVEPPEGEPSIVAVQVSLELYGDLDTP